MFDFVHSKQEEGWRPEGATIATQTSPFSKQQEQGPIIMPVERINATIRARRCKCEEEEEIALGIISSKVNQIN